MTIVQYQNGTLHSIAVNGNQWFFSSLEGRNDISPDDLANDEAAFEPPETVCTTMGGLSTCWLFPFSLSLFANPSTDDRCVSPSSSEAVSAVHAAAACSAHEIAAPNEERSASIGSTAGPTS